MGISPEVEREIRDCDVVEDRLVAAAEAGADSLHFRRSIPVRRRGHAPRVRRETEQDRLLSRLLPDELSEVQLPGAAQLGRAGIPEV